MNSEILHLLINQSEEISGKQFSGFGLQRGQIRPLMHVTFCLLKLFLENLVEVFNTVYNNHTVTKL